MKTPRYAMCRRHPRRTLVGLIVVSDRVPGRSVAYERRSIEVCDADRQILEVVSILKILKKVIPPQVLDELRNAPD
jgi:hypothetical protein